MKFRDYYFKRESTVSDSDTVIIDISIKDPISYITVEYEATNGATSCLDHELHDDVSLIELVDGSDKIYSLSLADARGVNFWELGHLPHAVYSEVGGAKQEESCVLLFGRYPDDLEYYLDPTKYKNLQLRLTHSLTVSATAGFATGSGKVTVMARVIEEGAEEQKGFMSTKTKYSWTAATSGDEMIALPTDYPYRALFLRALLSTYRPDEVITKLKLSVDGDKYVVYDKYVEDIMDENQRFRGLARQEKHIFSAHDGTALLDIYDIRYADIRSNVADHIAHLTAIDAEKITNELYDLSSPATPATQAAAKDLQVTAYGVAPHAVLATWFGDPSNPSNYLPAPSFGSIELYATQAAAGSCAVILQQVRK